MPVPKRTVRDQRNKEAVANEVVRGVQDVVVELLRELLEQQRGMIGAGGVVRTLGDAVERLGN